MPAVIWKKILKPVFCIKCYALLKSNDFLIIFSHEMYVKTRKNAFCIKLYTMLKSDAFLIICSHEIYEKIRKYAFMRSYFSCHLLNHTSQPWFSKHFSSGIALHPVFRIRSVRICIDLASWIQFRIDLNILDQDPYGIGNTDPDPGELKWRPKMNRITKFLFLKIFDSICNRPSFVLSLTAPKWTVAWDYFFTRCNPCR